MQGNKIDLADRNPLNPHYHQFPELACNKNGTTWASTWKSLEVGNRSVGNRAPPRASTRPVCFKIWFCWNSHREVPRIPLKWSHLGHFFFLQDVGSLRYHNLKVISIAQIMRVGLWFKVASCLLPLSCNISCASSTSEVFPTIHECISVLRPFKLNNFADI